jgi:ribosomal-protein-alanine N-acetyltransferase
MVNINFDPFPVIETDRLILRKPELRDVDELFTYRSDKEFMRYIPHRHVTTKDEVVKTIALIHSRIEKKEGINWAITLKGDDTIVGIVGYVEIYEAHYRAEIGYMLFTPHHGTGVMVEATQAAIDYGFNIMNLHSIEGIVNHENIPSKRVLEKLGFTNDAFFKDYLHNKGTFISANVYSLVRE